MGEKRAAEQSPIISEDVKALLLDIEGTTTPISFVHDVLFPHVKKNLQSYLERTWDSEECQADVEALRQQAVTDKKAEVDGVVEIPNSDSSKEEVLQAALENVLWQMSLDRKTTALKQLQGHMWKGAYENEEIKGEVYDDVGPNLKKLVHNKLKVYIYSSGSVEAQKLLFGHSNQGNLQELLSGNFDTKMGAKGESESYKNICAEMGCQPKEVLFLTDVVAECKAAIEAGLQSAIVVRPGNKPLSDEDKQNLQIIHSFDELVAGEEEPVEKAAKMDGSGDGVSVKDGENEVDEQNGDGENADDAGGEDDDEGGEDDDEGGDEEAGDEDEEEKGE